MKNVVPGVQPDAPIEINTHGGKQSKSPYGFHLMPIKATFAAAGVVKYGADKYDEKPGERNYMLIPTADHVNHCITHLYAFLAGDTSDDHLGHAIVRAMFAYETDQQKEEAETCK